MLFLLSTFLAVFQASVAIEYVMEPYNNSVAVGSSGMLACIIRNKADSDSVSWKKLATDGTTWVTLSIDARILADPPGKYGIVSSYNLTILNAVVADEGLYECVVDGLVTKQASLTTVVLPRNVSIFWNDSLVAGTSANVYCKATYGHPPPAIRWYKGNADYTSRAHYSTGYVDLNGYGDATSYLPLTLTGSDQGVALRCEIEYDGWPRAVIETRSIHLSGASSLKRNVLFAILITVVAMRFRS